MAQPQMNLSASLRRAVDTDAGQEMYDNVSNAVLEALDRSCYSTKLSKSDKAKFVTELRIQGQQIVHSLMVRGNLWRLYTTSASDLRNLECILGHVKCPHGQTLTEYNLNELRHQDRLTNLPWCIFPKVRPQCRSSLPNCYALQMKWDGYLTGPC